MTIYIDVDGVLADFAGEFLSVLYKKFDIDAYYHDVTSFDFSACVCTKEQQKAVFEEIDRTRWLVETLRPHAGVRDALTKLRALGRVVAATSPRYGGHWVNERVTWLKRFGFEERDIVFCNDKSLLQGAILIDDGFHNIKSAKTTHTFLIDRPWNKNESWRTRGTLQQAVDFVAAIHRWM